MTPAVQPPMAAVGPKDTLIMSVNLGLAISIDPTKITDKLTTVMGANAYDRLVELDASGNPAPGLATSWERLPDGRTWIFKIRRDVRFWNGDLMTARDLEYSYRRVIKIKGSPFQWFRTITLVDPPEETVKALDDWTSIKPQGTHCPDLGSARHVHKPRSITQSKAH